MHTYSPEQVVAGLADGSKRRQDDLALAGAIELVQCDSPRYLRSFVLLGLTLPLV